MASEWARRLTTAGAAFAIIAAGIGSGAARGDMTAADCRIEAEPNDRLEEALAIEGGFCQTGTASRADQDLVLWTVTPAAALFPWTFRVEGVQQASASLHVIPVISAPEETSITAGAEVLRVDSDVESGDPGVATDITLAPGRYVLGITLGESREQNPVPFDYRVSIEPSVAAPPLGDLEPNDVPETASPVSGAFSVMGDLLGSDDVYSWTLDEEDAWLTWDLDARMLPGTGFFLRLETDAGLPLAVANTGEVNAHLYDLRLQAGTYRVTLGAGTATTMPYILSAVATFDPNADAEPNNSADLALPIVPGSPMRGRLAGPADIDTYRLTVDDTLATRQLDVRLDGGAGVSRQLCVVDATRSLAHCSQGLDGVGTLSNLLLPVPGDYFVEVSGAELATDGYDLRVDDVGPVTTAREIEPNDDPARAAPLDVLEPLTGHADRPEVDVYRAHVTGVPQLWRVDVTGQGVEELTWIREDERVLGTGASAPEGGRLVLRDLWLLPGDHWLRIRARDGDYTVTFSPLGQPPANGELEPNDESIFAGTITPGVERVGRIADPPDIDVVRFSLAAAEPVSIVITPPADGAMGFSLDSSGVRLADVPAGAAGAEARWDGPLPAGDHEVWIRAAIPSESNYTVRVDHADPFLADKGPTGELPLTVEVEVAEATVAAWWSDGQRVAGTVTLTGTDPDDRPLVLDARTSDDAWSVDLAQADVTVPAAGSIAIPFTIAVPADAQEDVPVRITIAARDAGGAWSSGFTEITPARETLPIAPEQAWTLPAALLGGLDVAAVALGGVPTPGGDPVGDALLHDGYAVPGPSWQASLSGGPVTVGVDLAGDAALPIAGFIIDPLGGGLGLTWRPRDVELLLSEDGIDYRVVLAAELSPVLREQAFVLDQPVAARFAQLRIGSAWASGSTSVALGEWKVIASPGSLPDTASVALNIADPRLGGHVVALGPLPTDDVTMGGLLTEDATAWLPVPVAGASVSWTIGFRDDRTASITELQWVDPAGVDPAALLPRVTVEVSTDTTLGPWRPVATWDLVRGPDGQVGSLVLGAPEWARFLRFITDGPDGESAMWAMPATLRILERPTDAVYRSILGEWGRSERRAIAELLDPALAALPGDESTDGNDDAASATLLPVDAAAVGQVRRGTDVDWYVLTMPADQDLLTLTLTGEPFVAATATLQDASGAAVELAPTGAGGATATWSAVVEPGATYHIRVEQPPVSTAVTYDSSGSMGRYLPFIADALRTFAAGLEPERDAAMVIPFEEAPLLDHWTSDPVELQAAIAAKTVFLGGSSAAERGIIDALAELGEQPGTRALVLLTDAETSTRELAPVVMAALERVRPLVFTVHMGDLGDPAHTTHLMQDWAASSGGTYQVAVSHRDIDRTFQRVAAWLRRPARYALTASTAVLPKEPGTLRLTAVSPRAGAIGGVTVALVLDTSGSMRQKLGRARRIDVAKEVLTRLVTETLPPGIPVMLRTFVAKERSCDTEIAEPLGPLDPAVMATRIGALKVAGSTRTPLGATLHAVADDLAGVDGKAIVVFVTDGEETCKGDPAAEIQRLIDLGIDAQVNIVGFAIDDRKLTRDLAAWAALGRGTAYDADDEDELNTALTRLLQAPFRVFDADGREVAGGLVGGDAVPLPVGTYRVEVQTAPPVTFDPVVVDSGADVALTLGDE